MSDTAVRVTASSTAAATWSRINSVVRGFIELSQGNEGVASVHLLFEVYRHFGEEKVKGYAEHFRAFDETRTALRAQKSARPEDSRFECHWLCSRRDGLKSLKHA